ncbi:MAG: cyclase family protein [Bacteroidales bacterium]|nr:MAG: cyclase family protein [Bacteroidales bacterium]
MKKLNLLIIILLVASCNYTDPDPLSVLRSGQWIDLTWDFDENTIYWPTNEPFRHDTVFYGISENGYFYSSFKYSAEEHGGTHFDAPVHFGQGQNSIEQVHVSQCTGEGIVVDVSEKALQNADYLVTTEDFISWESEYGQIPDQAIVLLYTGYGQFWNEPEKYIGTAKSGADAIPELHFPGLDPDAAEWLVKERNIRAVGLDTPSIDYGQSEDFMTHRILCEHGLTIYENVANLDRVPSVGAYIIALPMKIKGGSGAPLRIVAFISSS